MSPGVRSPRKGKGSDLLKPLSPFSKSFLRSGQIPPPLGSLLLLLLDPQYSLASGLEQLFSPAALVHMPSFLALSVRACGVRSLVLSLDAGWRGVMLDRQYLPGSLGSGEMLCDQLSGLSLTSTSISLWNLSAAL